MCEVSEEVVEAFHRRSVPTHKFGMYEVVDGPWLHL